MKSPPIRSHTAMIAILLPLVIGCGVQAREGKPDNSPWRLDARYDLSVPEPSGLSFDAINRCLWTVSDRTGKIYQLSLFGDRLDELPWIGNDPEGIAVDVDNSLFYIAEEFEGAIVVVDRQGNEVRRVELPNVGAGTNNGLEGVALSRDKRTLATMRESTPSPFILMDTSGTVLQRTFVDFASDYSGICYAGSDSTFYVLSDEDEALFHINRSGTILQSWSTGVVKAEGIAVESDTFYIVSDKESALYRFIRE